MVNRLIAPKPSGVRRAARLKQPGGELGWELGHQPALDGLRGTLLLAVLGFHGCRLLPGSAIAMDVFFVLSGFLITCLLIEEQSARGQIRLRRFYLRRVLRLLPALVLMLAVYVLVSVVFCSAEQAHAAVVNSLIALFYQSNWVRAFDLRPLDVLTHTWSLSVEEQFYILWPIALVLLYRLNFSHRRMALGLCSLAGLIWLYRASLTALGVSVPRLYNGFDTRADDLLLGCASAFVVYGLARLRGHPGAKVLGIAANVLFVGMCLFFWQGYDWTHPALYYGGFTLTALSGVVIILAVALKMPFTAPLVWVLEIPVLVWLGQISYSVYLWHTPVFVAYRWLFAGRSGYYWLPPALLTTFGIAALSYYLWERPFLRLKQRFAGHTSEPLPNEGATLSHRSPNLVAEVGK